MSQNGWLFLVGKGHLRVLLLHRLPVEQEIDIDIMIDGTSELVYTNFPAI
jgi:hypothetical protein